MVNSNSKIFVQFNYQFLRGLMFECICVLFDIVFTSHTKYKPFSITKFTHSTGSLAIIHQPSSTCHSQSLQAAIRHLMYAVCHLQPPDAYCTPFIARHHLVPASCCLLHTALVAAHHHLPLLLVLCTTPVAHFPLPIASCMLHWSKFQQQKLTKAKDTRQTQGIFDRIGEVWQ